MNSTVIMSIMAASILLTGCGNMDDDIVMRTKKEVAQSQVVGYASTKTISPTNIVFTLTEIWKGSDEASRSGYTNGTQFSDEYDSAGNPPEGAIIVFSTGATHQITTKDTIYVRSGRIVDMPVKEFRAKIGL
jgi:major membrane immunogen (membrane-anchored lipoprotein)